MCKIQWVHRRQRQNLHYGMANWLVILLIIVVDMAHAGILYSRSSIWGRATCRLAGCLRPAWRALSEEAGAGSTVADLYKARVANGASHYDETQYRVVQHLSKLQELMHPSSGRGGGKRPRGAYLCGSVGIGKTMMMDLFFESCAVEKKRRVHFHEFMLEVHRRVHDHKKALIEQFGRERHINLSSERDAIAIVAKAVAAESQLLCFDEFHVTDIADAMIMSRLFGELWKHGTVLVATSNRHPDDLYENGLNRPYFIPFIDMLKKQCVTVELNTAKDYRMEAVAETGAYFTPLSDQNKEEFYDAFAASSEVTGRPVRTVLPVMMGREVEVEALGDSCLVSFSALCEADRGPADYHAIVRHYNRIYLDGVRQLSLKEHNVVRRLIMLIDVIYDSGVKLVWRGEVGPLDLFTDMFIDGHSKLKVVVESDDLTPFDPREEALLSQKSAEAAVDKVTHIQHHTPSQKIEQITFSRPDSKEDSDTFQVMKGETAAFRDLDFAVRRAVSRLIEMSGRQYRDAARK